MGRQEFQALGPQRCQVRSVSCEPRGGLTAYVGQRGVLQRQQARSGIRGLRVVRTTQE